MSNNDAFIGLGKRTAKALSGHSSLSGVSREELMEGLEILTKCSEYGLKPKDVLLNGLYDYPEMLSRLDTLHFPEVDNAFKRSGLDRDGSPLPSPTPPPTSDTHSD